MEDPGCLPVRDSFAPGLARPAVGASVPAHAVHPSTPFFSCVRSSSFEVKRVASGNLPQAPRWPHAQLSAGRERAWPGGRRVVSPSAAPPPGDKPGSRGPWMFSMARDPRGKAAARPRPLPRKATPPYGDKPRPLHGSGLAPPHLVTPSAGAAGRRAPLAAAGRAAAATTMAAASVWKGLVGLGLFALAHAAFSAAQHRSYMRLTEKEDETLPIDIVLQTLLAFAVTCYGIVHIAGEFKDMDATSELKNKTFDTLRNHPSFYVFNHRGRVLFQSPDTVNSSSNQDALSSSSSLKFRKLEPLRR
ncbi:ER membrane protein complex subunit 5 [Aquila chrysaetos chrysaetos]|nr:ER membrane protein complex subunit 5 [Aquila chrysaetos chrysaetos]